MEEIDLDFSQNIDDAIERLVRFGLVEKVGDGYRIREEISSNDEMMKALKDLLD